MSWRRSNHWAWQRQPWCQLLLQAILCARSHPCGRQGRQRTMMPKLQLGMSYHPFLGSLIVTEVQQEWLQSVVCCYLACLLQHAQLWKLSSNHSTNPVGQAQCNMMILMLSLPAAGACLAIMTVFVLCIKQCVSYWLTGSKISHQLPLSWGVSVSSGLQMR